MKLSSIVVTKLLSIEHKFCLDENGIILTKIYFWQLYISVIKQETLVSEKYKKAPKYYGKIDVVYIDNNLKKNKLIIWIPPVVNDLPA